MYMEFRKYSRHNRAIRREPDYSQMPVLFFDSSHSSAGYAHRL